MYIVVNSVSERDLKSQILHEIFYFSPGVNY